jgi:hypothetical protein
MYNPTIGGTADQAVSVTAYSFYNHYQAKGWVLTDAAQAEADLDYIRGPEGPQGPQGPAGTSTVAGYRHTQGSAATTWTVAHNLGHKPLVQTLDAAGNMIMGSVVHVDDDNLTISFEEALAGSAFMI